MNFFLTSGWNVVRALSFVFDTTLFLFGIVPDVTFIVCHCLQNCHHWLHHLTWHQMNSGVVFVAWDFCCWSNSFRMYAMLAAFLAATKWVVLVVSFCSSLFAAFVVMTDSMIPVVCCYHYRFSFHT
jgi:hypothetical protein